MIADVTVQGGNIGVEHLWCVHDCGRLINPDQVRAQCEGNLIWGLGLALTDQLPVAGGGIDAADFADAPIPRLEQVPEMTIELIDDGNEMPTGAGESAIVAAAGAILNGIRDATGVRPTRLPVRFADLRA